MNLRHETELQPDRFLIQEPRLIDPDGVTEPLCIAEPSLRARLRQSVSQAGEAVAVIGSIVAIGLVYITL